MDYMLLGLVKNQRFNIFGHVMKDGFELIRKTT